MKLNELKNTFERIGTGQDLQSLNYEQKLSHKVYSNIVS